MKPNNITMQTILAMQQTQNISYSAEIEAMVHENESRRQNGDSDAYGSMSFLLVASKAQRDIELIGDIANGKAFEGSELHESDLDYAAIALWKSVRE